MTRKTALFASHISIVDPSNGASHYIRALLDTLASVGWRTVVCEGPTHSLRAVGVADDATNALRVDTRELFRRCGVEPAQVTFSRGARQAHILRARRKATNITSVEPVGYRGGEPSEDEAEIFLTVLDAVLAKEVPDVVITFGGDEISRRIIQHARDAGAAVTFALMNHHYYDAALFEGVDVVCTCSDATRQHYEDLLDLPSEVLPNPIDRDAIYVEPEVHERRYLTFVSPTAEKGAGIAARILRILGATRPDVRSLIVQGRADDADVARLRAFLGRDGGLTKNVDFMPTTADPRHFLSLTKVLFMPSLVEPAGRVAAEAILNGIPVAGSRAGGLTEIVGDCGALVDLAPRFIPGKSPLATEVEAQPWLTAILDLWDNPERYERAREQCAASHSRLSLDALRPRYVDYFERLIERTHDARIARRKDLKRKRVPVVDRAIEETELPLFPEEKIASLPRPAITQLVGG